MPHLVLNRLELDVAASGSLMSPMISFVPWRTISPKNHGQGWNLSLSRNYNPIEVPGSAEHMALRDVLYEFKRRHGSLSSDDALAPKAAVRFEADRVYMEPEDQIGVDAKAAFPIRLTRSSQVLFRFDLRGMSLEVRYTKVSELDLNYFPVGHAEGLSMSMECKLMLAMSMPSTHA